MSESERPAKAPDRLAVALLQMCSQGHVTENLAHAEQLIQKAARGAPSLVVLPEACFFLGPEANKRDVAEPFEQGAGGPMAAALSAWAQRWQLWILAGGVPERSPHPERPYNTSLLVSPSGRFAARYRKMHLFDVNLEEGATWNESRGTTPGAEPVVAEIEGITTGLSICYDLRFPELYAWQKRHGAEILTVPAAFTQTTGLAHWHVLLRARAIENQSFVLAAAQQGQHPLGRQTFGHSLIVDAWGKIVAERKQPGPGVVQALLDLKQVREVRARMPLDRHRTLRLG